MAMIPYLTWKGTANWTASYFPPDSWENKTYPFRELLYLFTWYFFLLLSIFFELIYFRIWFSWRAAKELSSFKLCENQWLDKDRRQKLQLLQRFRLHCVSLLGFYFSWSADPSALASSGLASCPLPSSETESMGKNHHFTNFHMKK